jgi:UDP-N-acetylmuramate: L-alanyl-gamma-D-glutamyl-meso-diaminopimelate ligase
VPENERLDVARLAREITAAGTPAHACATVEDMVSFVVDCARPGDVVVAMSNGAFGGIWDKLLAALGR